jgi:hypothetical protein
MIAEAQIREQIGHYLRGEISLDIFEDWLVQRSWNMHKDSGEAAQKLASAIELRLAEHSSGHLDEAELRNELRPFVTSFTMQIALGEAPMVSEQPTQNSMAATPAQVIRFPVQPDQSSPGGSASVLVDTSHAVVLGSGSLLPA